MSTLRDDFPAPIRRALAERAAWLCSNPSCGELTIGPSEACDEKSVNLGVAAHIRAAAPGGCRYDRSQTPEERSGIANGIWLCRVCATRVDADCAAFPVETLKTWRERHEAAVLQGGMTAEPLAVELTTLQGLHLQHAVGATVTSEDVATLRQHELRFGNRSGRRLEALAMRLQFPEPILDGVRVTAPAGVDARARPDRMELVALAENGGSVSFIGPARPASEYKLEISQLLPHQEVRLLMTSVRDPDRAERGGEALLDYIHGKFLFEWGNLHRPREFVVPLLYEPLTRQVSTGPPVHDVHAVSLVYRQTF